MPKAPSAACFKSLGNASPAVVRLKDTVVGGFLRPKSRPIYGFNAMVIQNSCVIACVSRRGVKTSSMIHESFASAKVYTSSLLTNKWLILGFSFDDVLHSSLHPFCFLKYLL